MGAHIKYFQITEIKLVLINNVTLLSGIKVSMSKLFNIINVWMKVSPLFVHQIGKWDQEMHMRVIWNIQFEFATKCKIQWAKSLSQRIVKVNVKMKLPFDFAERLTEQTLVKPTETIFLEFGRHAIFQPVWGNSLTLTWKLEQEISQCISIRFEPSWILHWGKGILRPCSRTELERIQSSWAT